MASQLAEIERAHSLRRLARAASAGGIQILEYRAISGASEFYATDGEDVFLHRVTALSCDCRRFMTEQLCPHHAALLSFIGELPVEGLNDHGEPTGVDLLTAATREVEHRFRSARSTADFKNLQAAQARLRELLNGVDELEEIRRFRLMTSEREDALSAAA